MAKSKNVEQEAPAAEGTDENTAENATSTDAPTKKSIVPSKYAGKYKKGQGDDLAKFIEVQSVTEGVTGFSFPAFFALCRKNGIAEDKVAHYEAQVNEKRHGANGRARMTLRNMLATLARKNGKLTGNDDAEHALDLPKPAVSGAAAQAQAGAESTEETQGEAVVGDDTGDQY